LREIVLEEGKEKKKRRGFTISFHREKGKEAEKLTGEKKKKRQYQAVNPRTLGEKQGVFRYGMRKFRGRTKTKRGSMFVKKEKRKEGPSCPGRRRRLVTRKGSNVMAEDSE